MRNCTDDDMSGLCDPLTYWEGFFLSFLTFREIKLSEAQGEFGKRCLILVYASILLMNTFLRKLLSKYDFESCKTVRI